MRHNMPMRSRHLRCRPAGSTPLRMTHWLILCFTATIVGRGLAPAVQTGWFIIAYGNPCRARRPRRAVQTGCFIIVYGNHCRAGVYSRRNRLAVYGKMQNAECKMQNECACGAFVKSLIRRLRRHLLQREKADGYPKPDT